jgi:hypothetical protein
MSYGSRLPSYLTLDRVIGLLLFVSGLYAYTSTLAPTVLEGDAALFQYTPYVLGVTYPTGYPLYILLGKLWVTIFPFGEIAWRMNLFSTLCSATALPLVYGAVRRLLVRPEFSPFSPERPGAERWAALVAVLTFATLPTFWRWSTETKIYALNILLFSAVLYTLACLTIKYFTLPALLLGLQLTVHSTTVLLIPGWLLLVWLNRREYVRHKKSLISNLLYLILPGLLYFYIPLRAEWLIAQYGYTEAIRHGLLADFYHSGLSGWVRYFTAADFTGGVVTNWGLVLGQFLTVYLPLLIDEMTVWGTILGLSGGLGLALRRPRLFWPLFLLYAMPIPFVLTYGQGEQSAFLLPSYLIFSIFIGYALTLGAQLIIVVTLYVFRFFAGATSKRFYPPVAAGNLVSLFLFLGFIPLLFLPHLRYNVNWLQAKWDRSSFDYWADALAHPLPSGATLLAQWGDLTSFWYMQYAENRRPDLRGLYPPTEPVVTNYLRDGGNLFIAGPSSKVWVKGIEAQYQFLPWGRLVRIAPKAVTPQTLLPQLPQPSEAIFDNKLRLLGYDFSPQAVDGRPYGVTLAWQALAELPPETTLSLRLSQGDAIVAQLDDTLLSGWFPASTLPAGQYGLSYGPIPVPLGTLPGQYRLQLVVYQHHSQPWPLADGVVVLDLGEVGLILSPPGTQPPDVIHNAQLGYDFNGEIKLVDYDYSVTRVGQGKGFGVKLLWQIQAKPQDNYVLLAEVVGRQGQVLRSVQHPPVGGRAPTSAWQPGQFVRDQVDLVLPASAPVGEQVVQVRLSWLRPNGSKLKVRRWLLPLDDSLNLQWLAVTEKEGRTFRAPLLQFQIEANLDGKVRLLGYNTSLLPESPSEPAFRWSRSACAAAAVACQVHFDFYWQGLSEMDSLYFVFLHLVDEQEQIVAQHDRSPGMRGKEPTTSWLPGEVIKDPIDLTLPPDLPPGQYTVRLGLYLSSSGARLPVLDQAEQKIGEFVEVGTIVVTP